MSTSSTQLSVVLYPSTRVLVVIYCSSERAEDEAGAGGEDCAMNWSPEQVTEESGNGTADEVILTVILMIDSIVLLSILVSVFDCRLSSSTIVC